MSAVPDLLAEFVHDGGVAGLGEPRSVVLADLLTDYLGVTYAGARAPLPWLRNVVAARVRDGGTSPVLGRADRAALSDAAFLNGVLGHVLEYDDSTLVPVGHPSVAILPALLAVAADRHLGGPELLRAYAVGLDVHDRLGRAKRQRWLSSDSWAPIGVLGLVAAAAATARLIGLDHRATAHCLGLATQSAGYLNAGIGTGGKALVAGGAARGGLDAALLAEAGVTAALSAVDAYLDQLLGADPDDVVRTLTGSSAEPGIAIKRYPTCYGAHWAVDALLGILAGRDRGDVRRVTVGCPPGFAFLDDPDPADVERSRFSYQYVLATCLVDGRPELAGFTPDRLRDDAVRDAVRRVVVRPHAPDADRKATSRHVVTVEFAGGDVVTDWVRTPHGHPRDPLTRQEIATKFAANTADLAPERAAALRTGLAAVGECRDVAPLLDHLACDPP